jgi:hypothetical protein
LATESEGVVRRKYSDDDITVIRHIITPPRMSPSAANRINCDVRILYWKQYMKKCAVSSECSFTQSKTDSSPARLFSLSFCKSKTAKADVAFPIQNEGPYRYNGTGISSNIYQNAVLSSNTTALSSKDVKVSTRSEISKA